MQEELAQSGSMTAQQPAPMPPAHPPRSTGEKLLGIGATLASMGIGGYIGHRIGGFADDKGKHASARVFAFMFGLVSAALAWHANLGQPNEEVAQKRAPASAPIPGATPPQGATLAPAQAATIALPAAYDGRVQAAALQREGV